MVGKKSPPKVKVWPIITFPEPDIRGQRWKQSQANCVDEQSEERGDGFSLRLFRCNFCLQ